MEAFNSVWIVGDEFVKDATPSLKTMGRLTLQTRVQPRPDGIDDSASKKQLKKNSFNKMFLYSNFNVKTFYANLTTRGLNRYVHPFVEALNENHHLPQYVIVIPDKDMIQRFLKKDFHKSVTMGASINFIMSKLDMYTDCRRMDLADKRAGATLPEEFPYFIWIRMLKRPFIEGEDASKIYSLRPKFNSIMEDQLLNSKNKAHRIMSIEVRLDEFDRQGNLTSIGKNNFWREVDHAMAKFHRGEIKLLPRVFQGQNLYDSKPLPAMQQSEKTSKSQPRKPSTEFIKKIALEFKRKNAPARKRLWSPKQDSHRRHVPHHTPARHSKHKSHSRRSTSCSRQSSSHHNHHRRR